jgi:hypothetical protein
MKELARNGTAEQPDRAQRSEEQTAPAKRPALSGAAARSDETPMATARARLLIVGDVPHARRLTVRIAASAAPHEPSNGRHELIGLVGLLLPVGT